MNIYSIVLQSIKYQRLVQIKLTSIKLIAYRR